MRRRYSKVPVTCHLAPALACGVSLLLLFGFNGIAGATAHQDNGGAPGDNYVAGKDLKSASFRLSKVYSPGWCPEYAYLSIVMESGSTMPGAIIWDIDVDPALTGGDSALAMSLPTCEGGGAGPYKPERGFEFFILMTLRQQSDTGNNAICNDCYKPGGTCVTRGMSCSGCDKLDCYQAGSACGPGEPDCYLRGEKCNCVEPDCYVMSEPCEIVWTPCGKGMRAGEWYASYGFEKGALVRDRIEVNMEFIGIMDRDRYLFTLPWKYLLTEIWMSYPPGERFDLAYACAHAPEFQVHIYHDTSFIDGEDYMDTAGGMCLNLSDYLPNTGSATADTDTPPYYYCRADFDLDGNVYPSDLSVFLPDYGRADCNTVKYK